LSYGKKRGGGVSIAISKKISFEFLHISVVLGIEQVFLKLTYNNVKIIMGCIYIPPDFSVDMYTKHCEVIKSMYHNYPDYNFIITGDFNLNQFDWYIDLIVQDHISGSLIFNCYINYLNLEQVSSILNFSGRTLDCIMISADPELTKILYSLESLVPRIDDYHPP